MVVLAWAHVLQPPSTPRAIGCPPVLHHLEPLQLRDEIAKHASADQGGGHLSLPITWYKAGREAEEFRDLLTGYIKPSVVAPC